ncbi:MAG: ribonucleotide reductase N-terminal alpha domain-containing protein [Planctomycetota bacterium]
MSTTELQQPEAFRKVDGPTRGGADPVQAAALACLEALDPPAHLPEPALAENAIAVLQKRYLKKHPETGAVVETPRQAFWRVAAHIAKGELLFPGGTAERALAVAEEFYDLMAKRVFMPNSPTLMNAGREMGMLSACFVLPVEDSIDGIFDSIKATALIQKAGGGTGFSFSRLRPRGDMVKSSGGTTEGPLSFIQVFSKATDAIQQGAFRRGANMGILRIDHPDVLEFIRFKDDLDKIQNYNISVAVTNRFLSELARDPATPHQVQNPRTKTWTPLLKRDEHGEPTTTPITVGELWDVIIEHAWRTGEPGVVFIDRINEKNPIKNVGLIEATNPCFTGDTLVWTAEHGPVAFRELVGQSVKVLTQGEDDKLVQRTMTDIRCTQRSAQLVRVALDNGATVRCTPEHRFFLRDGSIKEAAHLQVGDRLQSAYRFQLESGEGTYLTNGLDRLVEHPIITRSRRIRPQNAFEPVNHRVVAVESLAEREDVYCGTVQDPAHRFFVALGEDDGVLVANCGEQPLHPYDSCNLGSINLGEFVVGDGREARFDWGEFKAIVHTTTRFLDNVIEVNKYPLPQIEQMSKTTRRIGLGVMGFADALYKLGLAYDSVEGTRFGEEVMRVLNDESHLASEELAAERGVFPAWDGSDWQARGKRVRNSYTTTVAPTGTISIIAGCSGGIEPMFSLAFIRQVMKDTKGRPTVLREVNHVFEAMAKARGFYSEELVDDISSRGTLQHRPEIPDDVKKVFVTAHDIQPHWHMQMQAAFQRHCDSSISKTINFSHDAAAEDVRKIYDLAVELDVKGVTVYRDGCRDVQPMALKGSTRKVEEKPATESVLADTAFVMTGTGELNPIRLPEIMPSLRIRQMTPFGNMHVKVSVDFAAGKEREVFAQLGKGGDVANSDLEAICRLLSLWLRSNGSLDTALKQLEGIGSSMTVATKDGRIMSLADGLARALRRYLSAKREYGLESLLLGRVPSGSLVDGPAEAPKTTASQKQSEQYKIKCPSCSSGLSFEEGCVKCHACGFSQC